MKNLVTLAPVLGAILRPAIYFNLFCSIIITANKIVAQTTVKVELFVLIILQGALVFINS